MPVDTLSLEEQESSYEAPVQEVCWAAKKVLESLGTLGKPNTRVLWVSEDHSQVVFDVIPRHHGGGTETQDGWGPASFWGEEQSRDWGSVSHLPRPVPKVENQYSEPDTPLKSPSGDQTQHALLLKLDKTKNNGTKASLHSVKRTVPTAMSVFKDTAWEIEEMGYQVKESDVRYLYKQIRIELKEYRATIENWEIH